MLMNRCIALTTMLLALTAAAAQAQSAYPSPRFYVDAGTVADFDPNTFGDDRSATPSIRTSIGAALPHRWTSRFELTIPRGHDTPFKYECGCSGAQTTTSSTDSHRIATYDFLVGRDLSISRRVQFTPLVGFSIASHADRENETLTTTRASATIVESTSRDHHDLIPSFVWGVDLVVAVSEHVAIVPQVRMNAFPQYDDARAIVRPGVALRIGF
jgi:hypothetical protein